uniref:Uncharacterized protein n=1 Tax=Arion vulgaris TaxID=1028688 RepID=A0A0B7AAQ0_9EUPU
MNHTPSYQDSAYAVHQRYEDTSLVIFHQLQKSKKGGAKGSSSGLPSAQFTPRLGGGVVVRSDKAISSPVRSADHSTPQSKSKKK